MSNFQPLEVVDRGSETQPQVIENLDELTYQDKGYGPCSPYDNNVLLMSSSQVKRD